MGNPSAGMSLPPVSFPPRAAIGPGVSVELEEIQSPAQGRKFTTVNRRPLDPIPIIRARFSHKSSNNNVPDEFEPTQQYPGLLCAVKLERVTVPASDSPETFGGTVSSGEGTVKRARRGSLYTKKAQSQLSCREPDSEDPECTELLFGTKVVRSMQVARSDDSMLVFVFGDLTVKETGHFRLRYELYDIFSDDGRVLASVTGESFQVWIARKAPPPASLTELTRLVSLEGASVPTRQTRVQQGI